MTGVQTCALPICFPVTIKRGKSGYKGVFPLPNGKFQAQIGVNGKSKYLGTFSSAKEAAVAYDLAAIEYHREFRKTNFDSDFPES